MDWVVAPRVTTTLSWRLIADQQRSEYTEVNPKPKDYALLDAVLGYRFFETKAVIRLAVKNLTDENYVTPDDSEELGIRMPRRHFFVELQWDL